MYGISLNKIDITVVDYFNHCKNAHSPKKSPFIFIIKSRAYIMYTQLNVDYWKERTYKIITQRSKTWDILIVSYHKEILKRHHQFSCLIATYFAMENFHEITSFELPTKFYTCLPMFVLTYSSYIFVQNYNHTTSKNPKAIELFIYIMYLFTLKFNNLLVYKTLVERKREERWI